MDTSKSKIYLQNIKAYAHTCIKAVTESSIVLPYAIDPTQPQLLPSYQLITTTPVRNTLKRHSKKSSMYIQLQTFSLTYPTHNQ